MAALAGELGADLVVVGPEAPLVAGVADAVRAAGIACFGPSAAAAQIEGSKAFAKDVMARGRRADRGRTGLRHGGAGRQRRWTSSGRRTWSRTTGWPPARACVVTSDREAADRHAAACGRVVIEEFLDGPEVSLFAITDGTTVRADAAGPGLQAGRRRRHRARTPAAWARTPRCPGRRRIWSRRSPPTVLQPTVDELARRGTPFAGLLYAGLALTARGIRVIEFNARFGDPETQPLLARLVTPLGGLLSAAATGALAGHAPAGVAAGVGRRCGAGGGELSGDAAHRRGDHWARRGGERRPGGRPGRHRVRRARAGWSAPAAGC